MRISKRELENKLLALTGRFSFDNKERVIISRMAKSMQDTNVRWEYDNLKHPETGKLMSCKKIRKSGCVFNLQDGWYAQVEMIKVEEKK